MKYEEYIYSKTCSYMIAFCITYIQEYTGRLVQITMTKGLR